MLSPKPQHCTPSTLKRGIQVLLILTPWIAISAIAPSPAVAATFARSEGVLQFTNFNYHPYFTDSFAGTNSLALIKEEASVASMSHASASLFNQPYYAPFGNLLSSSLALGTGHDYQGLSQSHAQIIGHFLIGQPDYFSFDFGGFLNSATYGNYPKFAQASGSLSFALLETTQSSQINLLDYFTLSGQSSSVLDNNFISYHYSDRIQATVNSHTEFNLTQSLAQLSVSGSLNRYFENPTHLTLIAINAQQAEVKVPEPNFTLSLILFGLFLTLKMKPKQSIK